ncbi:MAG TPA: hypothetical protein VF789_25370 [Thermoanaerobaculia bacterium]
MTIVYKGAHSNTLYTAYYDGSGWYGNDPISRQPGRICPESDCNPGVAVFKNVLYILYKGASSNALYLSWYDGYKWHGNLKISDMGGSINPESNYCPNLVVYEELLFTIYKGAHSNTLYAAWFDRNMWCGNVKISDMEGGISPESNFNPGMAVFKNKLYIVYKGAHSNDLYTATLDGDKWSGNTKINDQGGNINPQSNYNPGAVLFNGKLYIVYKGAHSNTLFYAWYDGSAWAGNNKIKIKDRDGDIQPESNYCPHVEVYDNKLYIVYKGAHSDALYSAWYDGNDWGGNIKIKDQGGNIDPESNFNPGMSASALAPVASSDWMRRLPDTVAISEINIPGSHDAAAINTVAVLPSTPYACHKDSITNQLKYGIRLLDVRLQISQDGNELKFMTCHGDWGSSIGMNTFQSLPSLLDECKAFLGNHSGEVILLSLKVDDWSNTSDTDGALAELARLLRQYPTTAQARIPQLGDVRGKIFLYNRINESLSLGVPIDWNDNTGGSYDRFSDPDSWNSNRSCKVYVQDRYKDLSTIDSVQEKFELVKNAFLNKKDGEVVWNFASATWYGVFGVDIIEKLLNYFGASPASTRRPLFGWTLFDNPFSDYITNTYGAMNIVDFIIYSNSISTYASYDETFEVYHPQDVQYPQKYGHLYP